MFLLIKRGVNMNDVREVSLTDQLRQDIRRQLAALTMPLVRNVWPGQTFVYFKSIPVGAKFRIAGCDRSNRFAVNLVFRARSAARDVRRCAGRTRARQVERRELPQIHALDRDGAGAHLSRASGAIIRTGLGVACTRIGCALFNIQQIAWLAVQRFADFH